VFSIVFAVNAAGIIVLGQVNSMLVGRLGSRVLLGRGLVLLAFGAVMTLVVVAAGGLGLGVLLVALFLTVAPVGLVIPNSTALAMTGYADAAGAASALLGALQFVLGGLVSPLVGIAGSATALPMACVMAVAGVAAIGVLRALEPRGVPVAV
jgi:DHA1 family bicyclomycin/chloramphenicol resistance-like MFS transporter